MLKSGNVNIPRKVQIINSKSILEKVLLEFEYCHERIYNTYIKNGIDPKNKKKFYKVLKTFNSYKMEN